MFSVFPPNMYARKQTENKFRSRLMLKIAKKKTVSIPRVVNFVYGHY